ncbi:MAG: phosphoribosylformylglycinamidine synthase subunit PurL [Tropheryma whipplei]|nr:phosphoribosylformylglycinamidine synthase subunit PurL [Tropheryma whipplei]
MLSFTPRIGSRDYSCEAGYSVNMSLPADRDTAKKPSAHAQNATAAVDVTALGLTESEYTQICSLLKRSPTKSELAIYSVLWSEHCSYKSSRRHLRQLADLTEVTKKHLLVGIGQNAGVVDIGGGWAAAFKIESHNHPSFIEPFQGAATGIGGIVRDIIAMGAKPVALMDSLRFGAASDPDTQRVADGVVSGISFYGNCLGVPNIGGETAFDPVYQGNPLVNVLCVGVMRRENIRLANASGPGNLVVLFGAPTGRDGIGGASVLASDSFTSDAKANRPAVQIGDPFVEKLLTECCLELYAADLVVAIQDLGAAGISCAASELAHNGRVGIRLDLSAVPLRDTTLAPDEILVSESQERMMAIVHPDNLEAFFEITNRWGISGAVIGEVDNSQYLTVVHEGKTLVRLNPKTLTGPSYNRPVKKPAYLIRRSAANRLPVTNDPHLLREDILQVISCPNLSDKSVITNQYDRYVQGNTALCHPDDAGVIRMYKNTGVALSCDGNSRYSYLDPHAGAQLAVAEAYRNVSVVGATPLAVTNCLNFGNPENPEVMWQFRETCRGLSDACKRLEIPITGGNVSFYNQTDGKDIFPTPVVGILGIVDNLTQTLTSGWNAPDLFIYLLGVTRPEFGGSVWADTMYGHIGGVPPKLDLARESRLSNLLVAGAKKRVFESAHDLSEGGLIQAIVESCLRHGFGADIALDTIRATSLTEALFSESASRVLVSCRSQEDLRDLCRRNSYEYTLIGTTRHTGELTISEIGKFTLNELSDARQKVTRVLFRG